MYTGITTTFPATYPTRPVYPGYHPFPLSDTEEDFDEWKPLKRKEWERKIRHPRPDIDAYPVLFPGLPKHNAYFC